MAMNESWTVSKIACKGAGDQQSSGLEAALIMATRLHKAQTRKANDVPYISHLLGVASLVMEDGGNEGEAIAALLHDAVEDQGGAATRALIYERFGPQVGAIVDGCTEPPPISGESWRQHKQRYLQHVAQASPAVHRVVLADKVHNGRSLLVNLQQYGPQIWQYFRGSLPDILWLQRQQVALFQRLKPGWMADELARLVVEMGREEE